MAVYRGRSTSTLGAASMRATLASVLPAIIAATAIGCVATAGPKITDPLDLDFDIGADSLCRVWGTPMDCEKVGPYLRDTIHVPLATDIHIAVSRSAKYEPISKVLES